MRDSNRNGPEAGGGRADIGRGVSLLLALACLVMAYFSGRAEVFHLTVTLVVLPLGCIWYGDEIGGFVGMSATVEGGEGNAVGVFIAVVGWFVLVAMLAAMVFFAFFDPQ